MADLPDRAIAGENQHLVWVDPLTGDTTVAREYLFEAAGAHHMALDPNRNRVYYQLWVEDSWFSCESVNGTVTMLDLDSGTTRAIASGQPALSPDGTRLAYLTSDECHPDPENAEFFISLFDALVIADAGGAELARFTLDLGATGTRPLRGLVWVDDETILATDQGWTHYRVPAGSEGGNLRDQETVDLPVVDFLAVVNGRALASEYDEEQGYGPLMAIELATGASTPIDGQDEAWVVSYDVGVSAEGVIIIHVNHGDRPSRLLVGVDLVTGDVARIHDDAPNLGGLDW